MKAERQYPSVLPCRQNNWKESKKENFVEEVIEILKKRKSKIVRIHESGDFYSIGYFRKWVKIARALPGYRFFCYTKRNDILSPDTLRERPANFKILFSHDGVAEKMNKETEKEYNTRARLLGFNGLSLVTKDYSTCPAQKNKEIKCGIDCMKCVDGKTVYFSIH